MQPTTNTETDRAFEVAPEIRHKVPWRVTSVRVLPNARLDVKFVDGTSGKLDMREFLRSTKVEGTVFEPLRDPAVFAEAHVVMGAILNRLWRDEGGDQLSESFERRAFYRGRSCC